MFEIAFAQIHAKNFYLYRVFDVAGNKKLFMLQGSYDQFCQLVPTTYKGIF